MRQTKQQIEAETRQNPIAQQISRILREERMRQGITQTELARRMGMTQGVVSHIELGISRELTAMWRAAQALGIDFEIKKEQKRK